MAQVGNGKDKDIAISEEDPVTDAAAKPAEQAADAGLDSAKVGPSVSGSASEPKEQAIPPIAAATAPGSKTAEQTANPINKEAAATTSITKSKGKSRRKASKPPQSDHSEEEFKDLEGQIAFLQEQLRIVTERFKRESETDAKNRAIERLKWALQSTQGQYDKRKEQASSDASRLEAENTSLKQQLAELQAQRRDTKSADTATKTGDSFPDFTDTWGTLPNTSEFSTSSTVDFERENEEQLDKLRGKVIAAEANMQKEKRRADAAQKEATDLRRNCDRLTAELAAVNRAKEEIERRLTAGVPPRDQSERLCRMFTASLQQVQAENQSLKAQRDQASKAFKDLVYYVCGGEYIGPLPNQLDRVIGTFKLNQMDLRERCILNRWTQFADGIDNLTSKLDEVKSAIEALSQAMPAQADPKLTASMETTKSTFDKAMTTLTDLRAVQAGEDIKPLANDDHAKTAKKWPAAQPHVPVGHMPIAAAAAIPPSKASAKGAHVAGSSARSVGPNVFERSRVAYEAGADGRSVYRREPTQPRPRNRDLMNAQLDLLKPHAKPGTTPSAKPAESAAQPAAGGTPGTPAPRTAPGA